MHKEVLKSGVIQGDETPVPVLDRTRDSTRKGYIWSTIGDRAHPYTTFHYTDSRSRDGPAASHTPASPTAGERCVQRRTR